MADDLRTLAALTAIVTVCLALWALAYLVLDVVWTFLLFLMGAAA
ncbi:hypothetical protein [Micromonospora sp. NBC_00421]